MSRAEFINGIVWPITATAFLCGFAWWLARSDSPDRVAAMPTKLIAVFIMGIGLGGMLGIVIATLGVGRPS